MKLFNRGSLRDFLHERINDVAHQINSEQESYILNVNVDDYCSHLVDQFSVDSPTLHWDARSIDQAEAEISASCLSKHGYGMFSGKSYRIQVINYYVPYTGDIDLLQYSPSLRHLVAPEIEILRGERCIKIAIENIDLSSRGIMHEYEQMVSRITPNAGAISSECEAYNYALAGTVICSIRLCE